MSRLVVVSNRMSVPVGHGRQSAGGMAVALGGALARDGGVWLGWSGNVCASDSAPMPTHSRKIDNVTYVAIDLSQRDRDEYYEGYANRTLWPLFHYRPGLTEFARRDMTGYFRVNRSFADALLPLLELDDVIWVHDYHLIPLASELRKRGAKNRIGFFLHIPWPAADVFVVLPNHAEIARALTAYDLVGFQTSDDRDNFVTYLTRETYAVRLPRGRVRVFGREFATGVFPVGIDMEEAKCFAERLPGRAIDRLLASLNGATLVLGVDRLDYSKGIGPRIEAIGRFIELYPEHRRRFSYVQIAPKSRETIPEYAALSKEVAEQIGRVNGKFGEIDWQPIRYFNRTIARGRLAGYYRMARVCLVTPLRDGMNLVAKEYVAAQDGHDPGVLVLSRFAGAARELPDAVIVNPYDIDGMSHALNMAFTMDKAERRERWAAMAEQLHKSDLHAWSQSFLVALGASRDATEPSTGTAKGTAQLHSEAPQWPGDPGKTVSRTLRS